MSTDAPLVRALLTGQPDPRVTPRATPPHRLINAAAELMAQSDAEIENAARATEVPLSAEGKWAHAWAADRIERSQR